MGIGVIRSIIVGIILVVLSFVLGSQAADSTKAPLLILGALSGLFIFNYMGQRCWWLLFVLPPVLALLPLPMLTRMPLAYGVSGLVLVYWGIMWIMGYVRMTWHRLGWLDVLVLVMMLYMAASFYRNPASVAFLGLDVDAVGGEVYIWAAGAAIYYLTLSCIPFTSADMFKALKLTFWACLVTSLFALGLSLTRGGTIATMGEDMEEGRYNLFTGVAMYVSNCLFCAYPLCRILISPWRLGLLLLTYAGVALSGFRSVFLNMVLSHVFMCFIRRQLVCLMLLTGAGYALLLYASEEKLLSYLPYGIQRSLSVVPGVEVNESIAREAAHSSSWRIVLWKLALDPRSGYIKDYVWGDGVAQSLSQIQYDAAHSWRATMRKYQDYLVYAERGVWHNGAISCIHRLGIVGLVLLSLCLWSGCLLLPRIYLALREQKEGFYFMIATVSFLPDVVLSYVMPVSNALLFPSFASLALIKVMYSLLLKEGKMPPMFTRQVYVPMAVREHEIEIQRRPRIAFDHRKGEM